MATASVVLETSRKGYYLAPHEIEVPLETYLRSTYRPDMDYVDGHIEERNLGEIEHSELQRALIVALERQSREWNVRILPECRLQVKLDSFRVPDIMVVPRDQKLARIVHDAPLLCIEVLSPEDNYRRMIARVDDYVQMGVKDVWVLDPIDGRVFTHSSGERRWVAERVLTVSGTAIRVDLDEIAADLAS